MQLHMFSIAGSIVLITFHTHCWLRGSSSLVGIINQYSFYYQQKTTADTAATEVLKTRVRSLLSRTKVGMVNYGSLMQFLQKLSSINVLV